jgi:prepilin-type N-terminal cleavage/methylation domain-containing protein
MILNRQNTTNTLRKEQVKKNQKSGFTLIEVLLSALIIAVLVIGGSAALYHTGSSVILQGNKRIALEVANQRLELARANSYLAIAPGEYDEDDKYFLKPDKTDSDILVVTVSATDEDITVGDLSYKLRTKVLRHSKGGGELDFNSECLQITATVEYSPTTGETVELTTLILPSWITEED